jgi:hypothetical protein
LPEPYLQRPNAVTYGSTLGRCSGVAHARVADANSDLVAHGIAYNLQVADAWTESHAI